MFYDWLLILIVLAVAVAHHDIARFEVGIVKQTWFLEFDSAAHLVVFKASGVFAAFAVAETLVVGFVVVLLEGVLRTAAAHTAAVAFPLLVVAFEVAVSAEFSALVFPSACLTLVALVVVATAAYGAFRAFEFLVADGATLFAELGMNLSTAFNIFVRQSLREGGIPFEVKLEQPNKETIAAMLEAERIAKDPSVKGYNDLDELFADLKK